MGLILDTNAISALAGGDAEVVAQCSVAAGVALPVIALGEYRFGVAQSRHRKDYERWLGEILAIAAVLDITGETARVYAEIRGELKRAGTPIPTNDLWIAALCRQHQVPLLSRDRHFDLVRGLERRGW